MPAATLRRLFTPRHIAVFGGAAAAEVIRQCRRIGYAGELWPVHPLRSTLEGLPCFRSVEALPAAPDAAFVGVPREPTVDVVAALARRGAGGAVCYASGFAEVGGSGVDLQRRLVEAAGAMPVLGPNCYGVLNYLDGAALWPDQHGGQRVDRGVAIITQSGNIGLNLTMQRRSLPLAYLIAMGNAAGAGVGDVVRALLDDPRITAIGLHLEGLDDVVGFSRAAALAHACGVPLVALKAGRSDLGARASVSHTSSLAGPDVLYDALFARLGIARVADLPGLIETLKLFGVFGRNGLRGTRIASVNCSGGEAALVADLAAARGLKLPDFPSAVRQRLSEVLGPRVAVVNPLDYHTYIWGDLAASTECFTAVLSSGFDLHLLTLDFPRADRCPVDGWETALEAFVRARRATGAPAAVVSTVPEGLPEAVGARLLREGIAPMQGLTSCIDAVRAAGVVGRSAQEPVVPLPPVPAAAGGPARTLDEWEGKRLLATAGVPVPEGRLIAAAGEAPGEAAAEAAAYADKLGYPVAVKAVSAGLVHKTEAGAVALGLAGPDEVLAVVERMAGLAGSFLVEGMVPGIVAELIVGVRRDPQFGLALTVGAGGVLVELIRDSATLLLPAGPAEVRAALESLRVWSLLGGYRGRPRGDVVAAVDAVTAIAGWAVDRADRLHELDVNPLLVLPEGDGVVAADVLIRMSDPGSDG